MIGASQGSTDVIETISLHRTATDRAPPKNFNTFQLVKRHRQRENIAAESAGTRM
jgi:hypothetical protein